MPARQLAPDDAPDEGDAFAALARKVLGMPLKARHVWMSTLEPQARAIVEQAMAAETGRGWRHSPDAMAEHLDPHGYRRPLYIRIIGDAYRRAVMDPGLRVIINMPARYGKSKTCSQWGPAWGLDRFPSSRSMLISYGDELAMENALACRDILIEHSDVLTAQLRQDAKRRDRFLTQQGGGILARGMGSAIRGFGVTPQGVLVCDDLFKDWVEAHSAVTRQKKIDTYRSTIRDRLDSEDAGIIHVCHRVHEADVTGWLLQDMEIGGEQWEHIVIPAIAVSDDDILGRAIGEVIDPERFNLDQVTLRHRALGSYVTAAQEQQDPSAQEGTTIKRAWFQINPDEPVPTRFDQIITSWDLKLKNREAGDFVVGQVWARVGGHYWMLDQLRGLYDHATTADAIALLAVRWPDVTRHVVEAAASADEVLPQLREARPDYTVTQEIADRLAMTELEREAVQEVRRRGVFGIHSNPVNVSKEVRAVAYIAPAGQSEQIHLNPAAPYLSIYLDEMASFPTGTHDDQVDATSQALQILSTTPGVVSMPGARTPGPRRGPSRQVRQPRPTG